MISALISMVTRPLLWPFAGILAYRSPKCVLFLWLIAPKCLALARAQVLAIAGAKWLSLEQRKGTQPMVSKRRHEEAPLKPRSRRSAMLLGIIGAGTLAATLAL